MKGPEVCLVGLLLLLAVLGASEALGLVRGCIRGEAEVLKVLSACFAYGSLLSMAAWIVIEVAIAPPGPIGWFFFASVILLALLAVVFLFTHTVRTAKRGAVPSTQPEDDPD